MDIIYVLFTNSVKINQLTNQSVYQSINQSINQSVIQKPSRNRISQNGYEQLQFLSPTRGHVLGV
jgi:hypothetical protein